MCACLVACSPGVIVVVFVVIVDVVVVVLIVFVGDIIVVPFGLGVIVVLGCRRSCSCCFSCVV